MTKGEIFGLIDSLNLCFVVISAQDPKSKSISVLKISKLIQRTLLVHIMNSSFWLLSSKTRSQTYSLNVNFTCGTILFRTCKYF